VVDAEIARRVDAFERDLIERTSTSVEPSAFGTAYLNLEFPQRYSSNFLWVPGVLDGVDADSLAADADRTLGEHGLDHRHLEIDDAGNGPRLAAAFLELGWSAEALVHMIQRREPEPRPAVEVVEADFATARPTIEAALRAQPYADSEEVVRQLTEWRGVLEREIGARFFLGVADGEPAAVCEAYVLGDVGQVEDVNTLEAYRGRGLASAVVIAASAWARGRGADLVFLIAAEDDWPKELYARLGFDRGARYWQFTKTPT
jgi:GNAT superfamily N-acetyltransferase